MTARIRDFLRTRQAAHEDDGPCLVVDLDVVRENYLHFAKALPDTRVFYAVKANPAPEVLSLLAGLGSCFDTASIPEIEMALAAGASADRISFGNTIKKERRRRARAYALGVRLYAVDHAVGRGREDRPRSTRQPRVLPHPLDCVRGEVAAVAEVRLRAGHGGRRARACPSPWPPRPTASRSMSARSSAIRRRGTARFASAVAVVRDRGERGLSCCRWLAWAADLPTRYLLERADGEDLRLGDLRTLRRQDFGNRIPETIIEPGRGMVGNAGVIEAEVVLVSKKSENDDVRWVYLDIGKFGGPSPKLMDESIRYPIRTARATANSASCVLAGLTCDLADVLYEKVPYPLPVSLEIGDKVLIEGTGAYTATYSSVAFNGFAPLKTFHI